MSNITDRGTLRGTIYRGAGTGTTDYTQLSNKPQINSHTLQGNQTGDNPDLIDKGSLKINGHTLLGNKTGNDLDLINKDSLQINSNVLSGNKTGHDLGLANIEDIPSVPTIEINKAGPLPSTILKSIHVNGEGYRNYLQFVGASPGNNGEEGIVPKPLGIGYDDYNKFLRGDCTWAAIPFPVNMDIIDLAQGDDGTIRTFAFDYIPKLIFILWQESNGWHFHTSFIYGASRCYSLGGNHNTSAADEYVRVSSISYSVDNKTMYITGSNASGAFNASAGTGKLIAIY